MRAIGGECAVNQRVKLRLIRCPMGGGNTGSARNGDQIRARFRRRCALATSDLINAVIPDHDNQILRCLRGDGGKTAKLHQQRPITFQRENTPFRLRNGHTHGNGCGQAHAAQHVEILGTMAGGP